MTRCPNCEAELQGVYCHDCGQKTSSLHLDLHHVLHDATHEFLHLDGKIWRTVKLLVAKPGMLTHEFLAGRRVRYITPIRLYLTFSVLFFALAALMPQTIIRAGLTTPANATAEDEAIADRIGKEIMHNLPRTMFVLMPAFGLLTWLFYRRQQPYYIAHLYCSIHFHAFTFFVLAVAMLLGFIPQAGKILGGVAFLTAVPYGGRGALLGARHRGHGADDDARAARARREIVITASATRTPVPRSTDQRSGRGTPTRPARRGDERSAGRGCGWRDR